MNVNTLREDHSCEHSSSVRHPAAPPFPGIPPLLFDPDPSCPVPSAEECAALWQRYAMLEHIKDHSRMVAEVATILAARAAEQGAAVDVPSVRAAALLHDLGKSYTIEHGGNHGQVGASWVVRETKNPLLAQGVLHHMRWQWDVNADEDRHLLCYCIIYADKRVMHDRVVSTSERFADLLDRYGQTESARQRIESSHRQGLEIEAALSRRLKVALNEHTFDCGRLVQRA